MDGLITIKKTHNISLEVIQEYWLRLQTINFGLTQEIIVRLMNQQYIKK